MKAKTVLPVGAACSDPGVIAEDELLAHISPTRARKITFIFSSLLTNPLRKKEDSILNIAGNIDEKLAGRCMMLRRLYKSPATTTRCRSLTSSQVYARGGYCRPSGARARRPPLFESLQNHREPSASGACYLSQREGEGHARLRFLWKHASPSSARSRSPLKLFGRKAHVARPTTSSSKTLASCWLGADCMRLRSGAT